MKASKNNNSAYLKAGMAKAALTSIFCLLPSLAIASDLKIHDCAGNLRASTEIEEGSTKGLKFTLTEQSNFVAAKLSKMETSSVLESRASDEILKFDSVQSGSWKLCNNLGNELAFESVQFIESPESSLRLASLVAGGAAVVSGIAIASEDSGSSENNVNSIVESNGPDRGVNEIPVETARPTNEIIVDSRCNKIGSKPSTLSAKTQASNPCREGEDAPIISPYD
jgi:hypothetical protein